MIASLQNRQNPGFQQDSLSNICKKKRTFNKEVNHIRACFRKRVTNKACTYNCLRALVSAKICDGKVVILFPVRSL